MKPGYQLATARSLKRWKSLTAGLTLLIQALDVLATVVSVTPAFPVTTSLASDGTTTTDPLGTDPSFKAGKDL